MAVEDRTLPKMYACSECDAILTPNDAIDHIAEYDKLPKYTALEIPDDATPFIPGQP